MASDQEATNNISYSWNEGTSWETLEISETPFEISNIIIEPTNTGISFIVYGENVVGAIDFSSLHQRNCQGYDTPDAYDSDYELWSPNDENNQKCLMGKRMTYTRRKKNVECFNTQQFERKNFIENCECTEEDWECDIGFERKAQEPCQEIKGFKSGPIEEPSDCFDYYLVSQGYRKVAGDVCIGGIDHSPLKIPCSKNNTLHKSHIFILMILFLLIISLVVFGTENTLKFWILDKISKIKKKKEKNDDYQYTENKNDGENMMDENESDYKE